MGVMTMKMISSTSITSTIGVTLIVELTLLPSSRTEIPIVGLHACEFLFRIASGVNDELHLQGRSRRAGAETSRPPQLLALAKDARLPFLALLDEVVDQFARRVVHLDVKVLDTSGEVVERHHGGNGHEQAECRGYQGFGNSAGDRADARSLLSGDLLESVQNADDGTQQPNERSRGADGGQNGKAPLQLGVNEGRGAGQGARRALDGRRGRQTGRNPELRQACGH